MTIACLLLPIS